MKKLSFILTITGLLVFLFSACEKETNDIADGNGILKLSITDSPIDTDGITGVYITFIDVQYHTQESGWNSFEDFEGPQVYNLLDLTRGETDLLGFFEMEAGTYTQLRFMLEAPQMGGGSHSNPGCWLEFEDGTEVPLFVPSGAQSGYKAVGQFTVPANGTVSVTADFDVRKSVVKAGNSGKYILKPTIRLIIDDQSGAIAGDVFNIREDHQIVIYAYEEGIYTEDEAADPEPENPRFPNAVVSDPVDEEGHYYLAFLAPVSYDLVIVLNLDGDFNQVLGIVENITVEANEVTLVDIDLDDFYPEDDEDDENGDDEDDENGEDDEGK
ncbi:MAG: DUF4382 domain-containing protein [Bacteroidetes bacterium]|nr:MAG: DUF4382 domain-containing protein [Bacteroidota bacterium]